MVRAMPTLPVLRYWRGRSLQPGVDPGLLAHRRPLPGPRRRARGHACRLKVRRGCAPLTGGARGSRLSRACQPGPRALCGGPLARLLLLDLPGRIRATLAGGDRLARNALLPFQLALQPRVHARELPVALEGWRELAQVADLLVGGHAAEAGAVLGERLEPAVLPPGGRLGGPLIVAPARPPRGPVHRDPPARHFLGLQARRLGGRLERRPVRSLAARDRTALSALGHGEGRVLRKEHARGWRVLSGGEPVAEQLGMLAPELDPLVPRERASPAPGQARVALLLGAPEPGLGARRRGAGLRLLARLSEDRRRAAGEDVLADSLDPRVPAASGPAQDSRRHLVAQRPPGR
jgi:hypothetical protein